MKAHNFTETVIEEVNKDKRLQHCNITVPQDDDPV